MMIEIEAVREVTAETEVVATIGTGIATVLTIITKNLASHPLKMLLKCTQRANSRFLSHRLRLAVLWPI